MIIFKICDGVLLDQSACSFYEVYCATANPVEIIFVDTEQGRAILGIADGFKPKGIETDNDIDERKKFLRKIGYKY